MSRPQSADRRIREVPLQCVRLYLFVHTFLYIEVFLKEHCGNPGKPFIYNSLITAAPSMESFLTASNASLA